MAEGPINRTLEELIAKYQLHPEFCDVYVEGESDQGLIEWFLREKDRREVAVYPITVVTIPTDVVLRHGLEHPSQRSEVITLAYELEANCHDTAVTCIADADFTCVLGGAESCALLLLTDYTSMEMYTFDAAAIDKMLRVVAPRFRLDGSELLDRLTDFLQLLFAVRLVNRDLGFGLPWMEFDKCAVWKKDKVVFDLDDFLFRYLNTRGKVSQSDRFKARLIEVRKAFGPEVRFQIRGHDFIDVLSWSVRKSLRPSKHLNPESVRGFLMMQLSIPTLEGEKLFQNLLARTEKC